MRPRERLRCLQVHWAIGKNKKSANIILLNVFFRELRTGLLSTQLNTMINCPDLTRLVPKALAVNVRSFPSATSLQHTSAAFMQQVWPAPTGDPHHTARKESPHGTRQTLEQQKDMAHLCNLIAHLFLVPK